MLNPTQGRSRVFLAHGWQVNLMKLNLRDLFWLVLVAAVFTAWGLDHYRTVQQIKTLQEKVDWLSTTGSGHIPGFPSNIDLIVTRSGNPNVQSADTAKALDEALYRLL